MKMAAFRITLFTGPSNKYCEILFVFNVAIQEVSGAAAMTEWDRTIKKEDHTYPTRAGGGGLWQASIPRVFLMVFGDYSRCRQVK